METFICETVESLPDWLNKHHAAAEVARAWLEEGAHVVIARRADGEVQTVPNGDLDADVIADLLKWAAGVQP